MFFSSFMSSVRVFIAHRYFVWQIHPFFFSIPRQRLLFMKIYMIFFLPPFWTEIFYEPSNSQRAIMAPFICFKLHFSFYRSWRQAIYKDLYILQVTVTLWFFRKIDFQFGLQFKREMEYTKHVRSWLFTLHSCDIWPQIFRLPFFATATYMTGWMQIVLSRFYFLNEVPKLDTFVNSS